MLPTYQMERLSNPEDKDVSNHIKNIKQSLLKEAYENSLNNKKFVSPRSQKSELQTIRKTNSTLNTRKSVDQIEYSSNHSRLLPKYNEPNIFKPEPNEKSNQKKHSDRIKIMQEKDVINTLHRHQSLQMQKLHKKRVDYKMELEYQMARKQQQKNRNRQLQLQFQRSKMHRNNSLNNKNSSFIEYYKNAEAYHENNAQHYIKYFTNIKLKQEDKRRREKDEHQKQLVAMKIQILEEARSKKQKNEELQRTLQWQIYEKKSQNHNEITNHKNSGYIKYENNEYNPIYNPIDYKMDIHNKYVVNEMVRFSPSKMAL